MTKREKWLVGLLSTLLLPAITAASSWVSRVNSALVVQATSQAVSTQVQTDLRERLVRIENKLDRAIGK